MIKLYDGQITDLLPEKIVADTETKCVSYAIMQEHKRLLKLADGTRTLSVIDELPEQILDVLAVELRTPYYKDDMELTVKQNIIKRTLLWHTKAGTPSAVAELIEVVFGQGSVVEWFNYDEPPYTPGTFDIVTNAQMTQEISEYFLQIIQRVKNTRSHIRRILIERQMHMSERTASGAVSSPSEAILNYQIKTAGQTMREAVRTGIITSPTVTATNSQQGRKEAAGMDERVTAGIICSPHETIGNCASPMAGSISGTARRAVAMVTRSTKTVIFNGAYRASVSVKATQESAAGMASHSKITI